MKTKLTIFLLTVLFSTIKSQSIFVSGNLNSNTTWNVDTVYVTGNITINNGVILTINPGTLIEFQGNYVLNVKGTVLAEGTITDTIRFKPKANQNEWQGIRFENTISNNAKSIFQYCKISKVVKGFYINGYSNIEISNINITTISQAGIHLANSDIAIDNVIVRNGINSANGFYFEYSNVIISDCIASNFNHSGGKITNCPSVHMNGCEFSNNQSTYPGAGLYINSSDCTIENSFFLNNSTQSSGGGLNYMFTYSTDTINISNCTFSDNYSLFSGGGIDVTANIIFTNCDISSNNAEVKGGGLNKHGGFLGTPSLVNCLVYDNNADEKGGGIYNGGGIIEITNSTIFNNYAGYAGGLFSEKMKITNSIFWNNSHWQEPNQIATYSGIYMDIYHSNIQGGLSEISYWDQHGDYENCLDINPSFVNSSNHNFRLNANSYCINSGTPDTLGLHLPQLDFDSNPRISNATIDMGAFEFQGTPSNRLPIIHNIQNYSTGLNMPIDITIEFDELDLNDTNTINIYSNIADLSFIIPSNISSPATITIVPQNNWYGETSLTVEVLDSSGEISSINSTSFNLVVNNTVELCGTLSNSMTLSSEKVLVTCDVYIPEEITLTINPGVELEFQGFYKLEVDGSLMAKGLITDTISFTSLDTITGWQGIKFNKESYSENDSSIFEFCKIQHANSAYPIADRGTFYLKYFDKLRIENCEISQCITPFRISNNSNVVIKNSHIHHNEGSIHGNYNSELTILNSTITDNEGVAIYIGSSVGLIQGNSINRNYCALHISSGNVQIIDNEIDSNYSTSYLNTTAGIYGDWNSTVKIYGNTITNNHCVIDETYQKVSGGALNFTGMKLEVKDNVFAYNSIVSNDQAHTARGGAIYIEETSKVKIINNRFHNNEASWGGAIYLKPLSSETPFIIQNNQITNNSATLGGGIYIESWGGKKFFYNNTICNNTANKGSAVYFQGTNNRNNFFTNNIIRDNEADIANAQIHLEYATNDSVSFDYCNIENGLLSIYAENGNYTSSYINNYDFYPNFVNPSDSAGVNFDGLLSNWNLNDFSLCQNSGKPDTTGMHLYEKDILKNPRIVGDTIDLGAHEKQVINYFIDFDFLTYSIFPNISSSNGPIHFQYVLYNKGIATTPPTTINYYISNDSLLDSQDILYDSSIVPSMKRLEKDTTFFITTLPDTLQFGSYYLIAKIDPENEFAETDESNNIMVGYVTIVEGFISVSPSYISLNYPQGSSGNANVYSSSGWTVYTNADWLTANPEYGLYNNPVQFIADQNPLNLSRTTKAIIKVTEDIYDSIYVTQSGSPPYIHAIEDTLNMKCYRNDTSYFRIESSLSWEIQIANDWLLATPNSGIGNDTIMLITSKKNRTLSNRSTQVTVSSGTYSDHLTVTQEKTNMAQWAIIDTMPGKQIATDHSGNIYIARYYTQDDLMQDPTRIYLTKYDMYGNLGWTIASSSSGDVLPHSISCDNQNNIYLTGTFADSISFGNQTVYGTSYYSGDPDAFVAKFSENGEIIWLKAHNDNDYYMLNNIETKTSTSVYLAGSLDDQAIWAKYSTTGELEWMKQINGEAEITGITFDGSQNIYLTGIYTDNIDFGDGNTIVGHPLNNNIFIAKLDTLGTVVWVKTVLAVAAGMNISFLQTVDIKVDSQGNPVVLGKILGDDFNFFDTIVSSSGEFFFVKLNPLGDRILAQFDGHSIYNNGNIYPVSISVDSLDNIHVVGMYKGKVFFGGSQEYLSFHWTQTCAFFAKYDYNGTYQWVRSMHGDSYDGPSRWVDEMVMDKWGNHYINGYYNSNTNFDTIHFSNPPFRRFFLVKYGAQVSVKETSDTIIHWCEGNSAQLSISPRGASPFSYQWYFNNQEIETAKDSILLFNNISSSDEGDYYCQVKNFNGYTQSGIFSLNVIHHPILLYQSESDSICSESNFTLSVSVQNTAETDFLWKKDGIDIPNSNSSSYIINNFTVSDVGAYQCYISNTCSTIVSDTIYLAIKLPPLQADTPTGVTNICENSPNTQYTITKMENAEEYIWELLPSTAGILTATDTTAYIDWENNFSGQVTLQVSASNSCGVGPISDPLIITINPLPSQPNTPIGESNICINSPNSTYTINEVQNASSYLWEITPTTAGIISNNGINATIDWNDTFTGSVQLYVSGINNCGAGMVSESLEILINPISTVNVNIEATNDDICEGEEVIFSAIPENGGENPFYQWQLNGENIGDNSPTYISSTITDNDNLNCILTSSETCVDNNPANSNTIIMNVNTNLLVNISVEASNNNICAGEEVIFSAITENGGENPFYQWQVNGENIGTNSSTYTSSLLADNDEITCILTSSETCTTNNPAYSDNIIMTVNPILAVSITIDASDNPICENEEVIFTATPQNEGSNPTFQWQLNGNNTGTNTPTYISSEINNNDNVQCILNSSEICSSNNPANSNIITMTSFPTPVVHIEATPNDTVCVYETIILDAGNPNATYLWSTGEDSQQIEINNATTGGGSQAYWVTVTDINSCQSTDTIEVYFDPCPGFSSNATNSIISIFPNPTNGEFYLTAQSINTNFNVYIINQLGKILFKEEYPPCKVNYTHKIDLTNFSPGIYLLKIQDSSGNNLKNMKLVKK